MRVLHVNQVDGTGGAAGICLALHRACADAGHGSHVLVGRIQRERPGVARLDNDGFRPAWGRFWMGAARRAGRHAGRVPGAYRLAEQWLPRLASPARLRCWWTGREDFEFPGAAHLLRQAPFAPDLLHLHNLHGGYFDLRELPRLGRAVPTLITLHDTWLLAGHCAYFLDCGRWRSGCGSCPRLGVYPSARRDATAYNWRRKREVYAASRLALACPARWLADQVRESMLLPAAARLEVIPNGVDTGVFQPGDQAAARARLGWPREAFVVLFAGVAARSSFYKDFGTMREAARLAAGAGADAGRALRFYVVGDAAPPERLDGASIEFVPHRDSMVECYQAADVYLHAAKMDTFPTTVLEALACGAPVVATAVGGITEQVRDGETGFLVPAGDAAAAARRLLQLARSTEAVRGMGAAARGDAVERFSLATMASRYLDLYRVLIEERSRTDGD